MEYLIGGLIGWFLAGGIGVVLMSILIAASKADDELLGDEQYK